MRALLLHLLSDVPAKWQSIAELVGRADWVGWLTGLVGRADVPAKWQSMSRAD